MNYFVENNLDEEHTGSKYLLLQMGGPCLRVSSSEGRATLVLPISLTHVFKNVFNEDAV